MSGIPSPENRSKQRRIFTGVRKRGVVTQMHRINIPAQVLAAREASLLIAPNLMGDPPPGRSALDRRESSANPRRDLLAGLVYRP